MNKSLIVFPVLCIVVILLAGCTASTPPPLNETLSTTLPSSAATTVPVDNQTCTTDDDCVPAQCCHPTSCINRASKGVCNLLCTQNCQGPLDCGAGSCGCVNGRCSVAPAATSLSEIPGPSLQLSASPQRFSPLMSSTVGVGITVNATGFDPAKSLVTWNATFGKFLSWGPVDFTVTNRGNPVTNHGENLYWSFYEKPPSTLDPVIITVTATDPATGRVLGNTSVTLVWDGDFAVMVKNPV